MLFLFEKGRGYLEIACGEGQLFKLCVAKRRARISRSCITIGRQTNWEPIKALQSVALPYIYTFVSWNSDPAHVARAHTGRANTGAPTWPAHARAARSAGRARWPD